MTTDDVYGTNAFILHAAIRKRPIFDSYKELCAKEYNRNMDYVDFEWKYYQFYHGSRDLTIEKSSDNSPPVTFSGLPWDVLKKVIGYADLHNCLALRKVSQCLRRLVDSTERYVGCIRFKFEDDCSKIEIGGRWFPTELTFKGTEKGCLLTKKVRGRYPPEEKKYEDERSFHKAMLSEASSLLNNPRLEIHEFHVSDERKEGSDPLAEFAGLLMALGFQLDVQSLTVHSQKENFSKNMLPILNCMKSGSLKRMSIDTANVLVELDELAETEQWKMAEELSWSGILEGSQMEKLLNFKEIFVHGIWMTDENVIMIRDILMKSTHLESCRFVIAGSDWGFDDDDLDDDDDDDELPVDLAAEDWLRQRIDRLMSENPAYDAEAGRFSIPNSRDYFLLEYGSSRRMVNHLDITRISET